MTPVRVAVVVLALLMGALLAVGTWGQPPVQDGLSDDDYISIALSDPQVFRPTGPGSGRSVQVSRVERAPSGVIVSLTVDGIGFRVLIDPRTQRIKDVTRIN